MTLLCQKLSIRETDIDLIQETYVYGDQTGGLRNTRQAMFSVGPSTAPRSCIFVRITLHASPLSEFCSRSVITVKMITTTGGSKSELTVTSACLPYDSYEPT